MALKHIQTFFLKKTMVLICATFSIGLLQLLFFILYKGKVSYINNLFSSFRNFFRDFLIDRLLIEGISILLSIWLLITIHRYIKFPFPKSFASKVSYYLKCISISILSALIFLPIGIFLRFLWRNGLDLDPSKLSAYFGNSIPIFLQTLPPFLIINYILITLNLKHQTALKNSIDHKGTIEVINENGKVLIPISTIYWIEKKGRVYEVKTVEKLFFIRKTLSELEDRLSTFGFIRINRSVIANKKFIYNYSFWEYDKFILRIKDLNRTEFVVSRKRMKHIKELLSINVKQEATQ